MAETPKGTFARVLADSVGEHGCRLTTVECRFPRIILSQFRTYGMLSYSVRSSRAVPVKTLLAEVRTDPFVPATWRRAVKGMVPGELMDTLQAADSRNAWLAARDAAVDGAERLLALHCSKEHANRLLEPFAWSWAVVTGTADAWGWLFEQRCKPDAQGEFRDLACAVRDAMGASGPRRLAVGGWHLPYLRGEDDPGAWHNPESRMPVSAARCARVSYRPFAGEEGGVDRDVSRGNQLTADKHLSPFEHQAMCCATPAHRAKLAGWMSYRTYMGY